MKQIIFCFCWLCLSAARADQNAGLFQAASSGDVPGIRAALSGGAAIESRNEKGWTPLIVALQAQQKEAARALVAEGANVNALSTAPLGSTALCFATTCNDPTLLDFLVTHGADINGRTKQLADALYVAANHGKIESVKYLLSRKADPNQLTFRNETGVTFTALMSACISNDPKTLKLLLDSGARLERRNNIGQTALMVAAENGKDRSVQFLIETGAKIDARMPEGQTALFLAVEEGEFESVKLLLAAGADPWTRASNNARKPDGQMLDILEQAKWRGGPDIVAAIESARQTFKKKKLRLEYRAASHADDVFEVQ